MSDSKDDLDLWVEALQGKSDANDPLAASLREAVIAELSEEEASIQLETELAKQRLLARLRRQGLLDEKLPKRRNWMLVGFATAAAIMLAIPFAFQFNNNIDPLHNDHTVRGSVGTVKIVSENLDKSAAEVQMALNDMGLHPSQTTSDLRIEIQVDVEKSDLPTFSPWFATQGGRAVTPGTYSIIIIQPKAK